MHPSNTPALLDYLPTWNPVTGNLYFFRSIRSSDSTSLVLYRIPAAGSSPEQVMDLTNRLPIPRQESGHQGVESAFAGFQPIRMIRIEREARAAILQTNTCAGDGDM